MSRVPLRGYAKCTKCSHTFYCDTFTVKSRKRKCKCGNVQMGIVKIEDSKYPFYITVSYEDTRPEFGDEKVER
tara:strand:+ start:208 stop:426 length:219 start_codon:yes stop_codon:yes gene_type:complete